MLRNMKIERLTNGKDNLTTGTTPMMHERRRRPKGRGGLWQAMSSSHLSRFGMPVSPTKLARKGRSAAGAAASKFGDETSA